MGREIENSPPRSSYEIEKNNISSVRIEKEKPYGIYLPDWDSVVEAIKTFASGDFQMAPLSKEEVLVERELRKEEKDPNKHSHYSTNELHTLLQIHTVPSLSHEDFDLLRIEEYKSVLDEKGKALVTHSSYAFYEKEVRIEALRSERRADDRTLEQYKKPYVMTLYSKLFENSGEEKLAKALGAERAVLPRRVTVSFGREEGDTSQINFDDVADRMTKALQVKTSGREIATALYRSDPGQDKKELYALYTNDGLSVTLRALNSYRQLRSKNTIIYYPRLLQPPPDFAVDIEHSPAILELSIVDPSLESRECAGLYVIPPEKRESAQMLAEKLRDAFTGRIYK